ncbi:hypothetical protein C1T17_02420 [Sphingobium sp. SCG-1]|uniref:TetR/AcrR family transcriptional regulator n=1 Tax=Sphingobium sp. SCG-1 TaxID=2072936 RepID=UPI000CD6845F|nr:TetR/AcrR family transcriptional regulator [Sphingobium sp. SCG-1]AUW57109.1 hypothetical protein C1T17_02420 [Sphingobium sp. SCG-1]
MQKLTTEISEALKTGQSAHEVKTIARRTAKPQNQRGQVLGNKGARTRQAIMDATRDMIFERAFRDISAVEIAKRAGVSVATLYTYFEDVAAVILALSEAVALDIPNVSGFLEVPWTGPSALNRIIEMMTILIDYNVANYPIIRLRNHLADEGDDRLAKIRSQTAQPIIDMLAHQIVTHGKINNAKITAHLSENARLTAGLLIGMIDRATILLMQGPYRARLFTKKDYVNSAARIMLAAVTALPGDVEPL